MSQQLNLFNPVFLRQKKYFSTRTMLHGLGIVLAALCLIYGLQHYQLSGLNAQLAEAKTQLKVAQTQLATYAAEAKRGPSVTLQHEAAQLETHLKARETVLKDLESDELGNASGFSVYLAALARQSVAGVWLTGFTATGAEGPQTIKGRLTRPELLPVYLRALNREEALRGHGFAQLEVITPAKGTKDEQGEAYVEFTLGATKSGPGAAR